MKNYSTYFDKYPAGKVLRLMVEALPNNKYIMRRLAAIFHNLDKDLYQLSRIWKFTGQKYLDYTYLHYVDALYNMFILEASKSPDVDKTFDELVMYANNVVSAKLRVYRRVYGGVTKMDKHAKRLRQREASKSVAEVKEISPEMAEVVAMASRVIAALNQ